MHIAYLNYLVESDTGMHHVRQSAQALRTLGHQVDVHAMNLAPGETGAAGVSRRAYARLRASLKSRLRRYLHEPKELLWNVLYVHRELSLLRSARVDVLMVRDHLLTASCVPVSRLLDLPLVIEVNAPPEEDRLYFDEYAHLPGIPAWMQRFKLRRADAVTAVSTALKNALVGRHGIPADRITVIPNGVDATRFRPDTPADPGIVGSIGGVPVVGFVGSFHKFHGIDLLAEMIDAVGSQRPTVRFLLVGDGPEVALVRPTACRLGDRVIQTGKVSHDRVPGLVAALDVGVMPESNYYGSPIKVFEWMAAGKAVVAPAYGPLQEVIDDGVHGLLFPPHDSGALVRAVLKLIDDPGLRSKLGRAAAARARASFTWIDNARRVLSACESALASRRASLGNRA